MEIPQIRSTYNFKISASFGYDSDLYDRLQLKIKDFRYESANVHHCENKNMYL